MLFSPAAARNREPILNVLKPRFLLHKNASVLEIAAGSGQHASFLSKSCKFWYPTDKSLTSESRLSIEAWAKEGGVGHIVQEAQELNVLEGNWHKKWSEKQISHVFLANLCHISEWEATVGLMSGVGAILPLGGALFIYGPFKVNGEHTAESNAQFDQSLRSRNPSWGIRDIDEVKEQAEKNGMSLTEKVAMPANNFTLIFEKSDK